MLRLSLAASAVFAVCAAAASAQTISQPGAVGAKLFVARTAPAAVAAAAAAAAQPSAEPIPNADVWGPMARLAGTAWIDPKDGTVWEFAWVEPGEIMTWKSHKPQEELTNRAAINAKGSVEVASVHGAGLLTVQSSDVFMIDFAGFGVRDYLRAAGTRLSYEYDKLENGSWKSAYTRELQPLPRAEVSVAVAALVSKQNAYRAEVAAKEAANRAEVVAKEAELKTPWGRVSAMQGRRFVGYVGDEHQIVTFKRTQFKNWDAISVFLQEYDEPRAWGWEEFIYNDLSKGQVRFQNDANSSDKIFFPAEGGIGYFHIRWRLLPDGNLEVTEGKWHSDGSFTPKRGPWIWRPYSDGENQQRIAQIEQSKNQSSGGAGGFGRMLAGAAMGAILGGGGQSSVDLAVTGAEAAAQGGNTLDVLNSMGNVAAANAAESKRQLDETIARAQGGTSAGTSTAYGMASSSLAGGATGSATVPSLTKKTLQVYFYIGTTPKPADDHNTHCQSNIFNVTIDWDPRLEASGGNLKFANPVLDGMKLSFIDKCNRMGRPTEGIADWYADAFSGWNPPPQLRNGDVAVTMP